MVPNLGIDIYPDSMDVFQILPKTAETCTMRYPIFVRPDARREAKVLRYLNARINAQVGHEDQELSERVQAGMRNFGYRAGAAVGLRALHQGLPRPHPRRLPGDDAAESAGRGRAAAARTGSCGSAARVN